MEDTIWLDHLRRCGACGLLNYNISLPFFLTLTPNLFFNKNYSLEFKALNILLMKNFILLTLFQKDH